MVGVEIAGQARAYPLSILVWHELVNDELGGVPVLISYCPLCGTALTFDRRLEPGSPALRFGVSGLLYQSDMLMYDRESESLWSQISAEAVAGSATGKRLSILRSRLETWGRWRARHPQTTVLSRRTGHWRDYAATPYGDYASSRRLLFPVHRDRRYHPKEWTLGVRVKNGPSRAYPAQEVEKHGGHVSETFAGRAVSVRFDAEARVFEVAAPTDVEVLEGYWFAWMAFHRDSNGLPVGTLIRPCTSSSGRE